MASDNIGTAPKRMFIKLPKKYMAGLCLHYALDHGLFITDLNPNVSESHLATYFKEWGSITMCKIRNSPSPSKDKLAYVRFSTEDEADQADWAGPHFIFGKECKVIRVVSPKVEGKPDSVPILGQNKTSTRRLQGLGYRLEDPKWLGEDDTNKETN